MRGRVKTSILVHSKLFNVLMSMIAVSLQEIVSTYTPGLDPPDSLTSRPTLCYSLVVS